MKQYVKDSIMTGLIAILLLAIPIGGLSIGWNIGKLLFPASDMPVWAIVVDSQTNYTYITYYHMPSSNFRTLEEAKKARDEKRAWSEAYDKDEDKRRNPAKYFKIVEEASTMNQVEK